VSTNFSLRRETYDSQSKKSQKEVFFETFGSQKEGYQVEKEVGCETFFC